jgi:hypothetical protein
MEKSNINVVVEAMSHIRAIRLDLNRNLTDAKLEIKESAIKLFNKSGLIFLLPVPKCDA